MQPDVLNPVIGVKVKGELVDVRELPWKDYLRTIKELTSAVTDLLKKSGPNGEIELASEDIIQAIARQEDLAAFLMQRCTGKDSAWVESLSGREALAVLTAAVQVNLSDEVVRRGKELAGHMSGVFGLKRQSLASSTTS